jgi:hypothetical protein
MIKNYRSVGWQSHTPTEIQFPLLNRISVGAQSHFNSGKIVLVMRLGYRVGAGQLIFGQISKIAMIFAKFAQYGHAQLPKIAISITTSA